MKQFAKNALCGVYKYSGAMTAQETLSRATRWPFMAVLLFHRVTDAIPEDGLTVSTGRFRAICRMLRRSFHVVSLAEVFRIARSGAPVPARTVAITFDDCYRDNLFAAEILAEHQLPACFFIPTSFVGTDTVFAWDRHLPQMPNLSWEEVRAMAALGHDIGSHTVTHANMAAVDLEQARRELVDSRKTLEDQLSRAVHWFAFPFGQRQNIRLDRVQMIQEAGYQGSVSGFGGFVYPHLKETVLPRESVPYFSSVLNLELHLTGCLQWVYFFKRFVGLL
jgi:peptidoglycan/xylan/chitin deacetylase (PgdA/CDA1 family)